MEDPTMKEIAAIVYVSSSVDLALNKRMHDVLLTVPAPFPLARDLFLTVNEIHRDVATAVNESTKVVLEHL